MAFLLRALIVALLLGPILVSCYSLDSLKPDRTAEISRRHAFLPLVGLTSFALTAGAPSALALTDISNYQDGPRGLKYLVTNEGTGEKPQRGQKIKTSYTLWGKGFPEDGGRMIDSSKGVFGNKPFEFYVGVSQVVKAWDLALLDMKVGEARRLVVPSDLGYGDRGAGGDIPPGATLYFSVTLEELGPMPQLGEQQKQWLEEHPL
jgi:hypothetical protein